MISITSEIVPPPSSTILHLTYSLCKFKSHMLKRFMPSIFSLFPPSGKEARATATASETSKAELSQKVSEANQRVAALQIQVTTSEAECWAAGLIMSHA